MNEMIILNEYKKLLPKGLIYIGLYGSQNYNLHGSDSDYDCIAVINLNIDEFILGKRISNVIETKYGNIVVKDIISFMELLQKGTPNYVEASCTDFWILDENFRKIIQNTKVSPKALRGLYFSYLSNFKKYKNEKDMKKLIKAYSNAVRVYKHSKEIDLPFFAFSDNDAVRKLRLNELNCTKTFNEEFVYTLENELNTLSKVIDKGNKEFLKNEIETNFLNYIKNSF